jgi:NDP-sugar pyrophosphorylase family protein
MRKLTDITAVILAGGLGTRLRSVLADRPKVLAEVNGRPFLAYLLDQIVEAGVRSVVICTRHKGEQVRSALGEAHRDARLLYSQEPAPLGTAGALRYARPLLQSDPILVLNGDSYCDTSLIDFFHWHQAQNANATLLLTEVPDTQRYGRVQIDESGRVLRFEEKGGAGGAGWISAGVYLIQRPLLETIPADRAVSIEREMFPAWIGRGLYGYGRWSRFLDIGTPEAYAVAAQFFDPRIYANRRE